MVEELVDLVNRALSHSVPLLFNKYGLTYKYNVMFTIDGPYLNGSVEYNFFLFHATSNLEPIWTHPIEDSYKIEVPKERAHLPLEYTEIWKAVDTMFKNYAIQLPFLEVWVKSLTGGGELEWL